MCPCVHVCFHVSVFRKVKAGKSNIRTICRFEYTIFEDLNGSQRLTDQTCFLVCFSQLLSKATLIDTLDLKNSWSITCSSINSKSGLVKYGYVTKMDLKTIMVGEKNLPLVSMSHSFE